MAKNPGQLVAIPVEPQPGSEPDEFWVTFVGADGSISCGTEFELTAGRVGTWELRVRVARPVAVGGGFLFQRRGFLLAFHLQDYAPAARDYVTLEAATAARLRLVVNTYNQEYKPNVAQVLVEEGALQPGDEFTVRIGDRRSGGAGSEVYDATTLARLCAAVDRNGSGVYKSLAVSPARITIVSQPQADMLRVLGPSIVCPYEPFAVHLVVFDLNRNVCEQYSGEVTLQAPEGMLNLPSSVQFGPDDRGVVIIENVQVTQPGLYRVHAHDATGRLRAVSNPTLCQTAPQFRLLWGDLHCHSWGDINLAYMDEPSFKVHPAARHEQARRIGRLDFAAPGPMVPPDQPDEPQVWQTHQQAYLDNDEPGTYVPFLAYEAHPGRGGDRNVIFREWSDGYLGTWSPIEELFETYGDRDDVLLECHVGGGFPRWDQWRPAHEPLVEIASGWGCFEWLLQRALAYGYRPAIIGAGDTHLSLIGGPVSAHLFSGWYHHWQMPTLNVLDTAFGTGPLAAVWAERCQRDAIWQALRQRRTYATTGARILLFVTADGHGVGSRVQCDGAVEIAVKAHACAPIERVDLIRNDRCLKSWFPGTLDFEAQFTDDHPLRENAYYVRLRQQDGEYAWNTPIWVSCPDGDAHPDPSLPLWNEHEPVDLSALRPNEAEAYEADLLRYLQVEDVEPEHEPISIRWYFEFEMPRIRLDSGWRDFGMRPMT